MPLLVGLTIVRCLPEKAPRPFGNCELFSNSFKSSSHSSVGFGGPDVLTPEFIVDGLARFLDYAIYAGVANMKLETRRDMAPSRRRKNAI